jgi:hypothetical protein
MKRIIVWALLIAGVIAARRVVQPWLQQKFGASKAAASAGTSTASPDSGSCARAAEAASEAWGRGLGRFVNPPHDLTAWAAFRNEVEGHIATAESICTCADAACESVRGAMRDLRALVADLDRAIQSGGAPPGDIVQRQEAIDKAIADAK